MPTTYRVTMQRSDGEVVERDFTVQWDPAKVLPEEVARACGAQTTCEHGFMPAPSGGTMPKMMHVGLTARIVTPEEELAETAAAPS